MNNFLCVFIALLLFSCNNNLRQKDIRQKVSVIKPNEFVIPTTRIKVEPLKQLPLGFKLDSIKKTDTILHHQMTYYFPVSLSDNTWNNKLRSFISNLDRYYYPQKTGEEYQSSVFDLWVKAFKKSDKKIEFRFMMQSYYHGAAHYNQDSAIFIYR